MNLKDAQIIRLFESYDSYYLADIEKLKMNLKKFKRAFQSYYTKIDIGFSVKTNYLPAFCKAVLEEGYKAEVVSGMEYDLVSEIGFKGSDVIFNGPAKSSDAIRKAIVNDSLIQVDSIGELKYIQSFCEENQKQIKLGLRLNLSVVESRFGISKNEINEALTVITESQFLNLTTLHCHQMPAFKSSKGYNELAKEMLEVYDEVSQNGFDIQTLNMGGGFASPMPQVLIEQLNFTPPTFDDYAKAIAGEIANYFSETTFRPTLILEPGLAVLSDTLKFYSKVKHIKLTNSSYSAIVSGSIYNIKPTKNKLNLPIRIIENPAVDSRQSIECTISGSTCMEDDIMHRNVQINVAVGDVIEFSNVGSYTLVLYPPFITPLCAVLDSSSFEELKSPSNFKSVFTDYKL